MEFLIVILIAVPVFGLCYLVDRIFTGMFRNKREHQSGKSVRYNGKTAAFGLITGVIGIGALMTMDAGYWILGAGGVLLILLGTFLVVQYLTFGIFYGEDSFVLTTFGKRSTCYAYKDIRAQQLYNNRGSIVIELHMADGRAVMLQSGMKDVYPFLDHAFAAWLCQTGRKKEDCSFYQPENSCWFPPVEE